MIAGWRFASERSPDRHRSCGEELCRRAPHVGKLRIEAKILVDACCEAGRGLPLPAAGTASSPTRIAVIYCGSPALLRKKTRSVTLPILCPPALASIVMSCHL